MARIPKTPWPTQVIRDAAKRAVDRVGGQTGFRAIGPTFQNAIICEAALVLFQTAASITPVTITSADIAATVQALRVAAGLDT
jgi:hypothetical protein